MNRRTRTLVVVGVAVVLASVAAYGVLRALQNIPVREVAIAERHIVVATAPIPVGTMLTADMVRLQAWPADSPVPGAFATVEEVVNRGALVEIAQNEPLTNSKVASPESGAGLPPRIPPGMRAMSVRVNDVIGVAGFAVAGTRVDVLVTVKPDRESISRTVVSNVQVLASGTNADTAQAREGQAVAARVVTLLVTPDDAERLALAENQGEIMLALRNPLDIAPVETRGIRMSGLLAEPDPEPVRRVVNNRPRMVTPPPPPAPKVHTVEQIRGAERKEVIIK
jgi:pilus assembly protein CpaB